GDSVAGLADRRHQGSGAQGGSLAALDRAAAFAGKGQDRVREGERGSPASGRDAQAPARLGPSLHLVVPNSLDAAYLSACTAVPNLGETRCAVLLSLLPRCFPPSPGRLPGKSTRPIPARSSRSGT